MEVIDDCTVFFLGILPRTLMPTRKSSLLNGVFPEPTGGKDDLQFNLGRVVDSLTRIVETRTRRVSV